MHMRRQQDDRRGQALVMVAFAMVAMFAFMALAVDLGLAYGVRKSAQAAADAAALAGAVGAFNLLGPDADYGDKCPPGVVCLAVPASCPLGFPNPPAGTCLYASLNGFSTGGGGYRTTVNVQSGVYPSPFAPNVRTKYWVMVQVSEQIPRIFGGILNTPFITVTATGVASIVDVIGPPAGTTVALVQ